MPNIAITTYCNLHCPYCFADTMIQTEDIKNITIEQFEKTLNWVYKNKDIDKNILEERIGLIGGEPTLHPKFKEILSIVEYYEKQYNIKSILFTNAVYLEKFLPYLPSNMTLLININTPTAMTKEQWEKMNSTLDKLALWNWIQEPRVTIGCNLCMEIDDYSFLWNIVDKYKIKYVRVSVTAPTKEEYKKNKDEYYLKMLPKFLNFVKEADSRNVILGRDCNYIPYCYYENEEELKLIKKVLRVPPCSSPHCGPVIDITPDFMASACFGAYKLIDCNLFDDYRQLQYYLLHKHIMPKFINNNSGKCKDCEKHKLLQCQGGCLAFSQ